MDTPTYTAAGSYVAYAGLIVTLLSMVGWNVTVDQVAAVIGVIVMAVGIIKQHIDHKNLAVAAGAIKK